MSQRLSAAGDLYLFSENEDVSADIIVIITNSRRVSFSPGSCRR